MKNYLKILKEDYLSIEPSEWMQRNGWEKIKNKINGSNGHNFKSSAFIKQSIVH